MSPTEEAAAHRARHALRPIPVRTNRTNKVDFIHGEITTNRHEARVALALAKKHRCDERGEHSTRCPKWKAPEPVKAEEIAA